MQRRMWHNHFSGYKNKDVYRRTPKFIDLQRALQPHNIKTLKHGPAWDMALSF
jgi:hypothetical protein